ncbi:MAG: type II toxin-antitoxin system RelE/ParE family toxin [Rhizobiaceae bacterium]
MPWRLRFDKRAVRELKKLSHDNRRRVAAFIDERLLAAENPRTFGKALTGSYSGLWRYRVGDVRIVARIVDEELIILVLSIGHRREVYR